MCSGKSPPPPQPPAPAPAPAVDPPSAPVIDAKKGSEKAALAGTKGGRNSLRIDLATSAPSGGSGLNIPTA